jgi:hypothetical protein
MTVADVCAELLAAEPAELLTPLVEHSGGRLVAAVREDVGYRPGRDAQVRFAATVERAGRVAREGWVLHAADELPAGALVLDGAAGQVAAWRVRDDPSLPSLRLALRADAVAGLLADLGLPADGLRLELLAYRPQKRAVVEVTTRTHRLFLKCLLPSAVAALHARHAACRAAQVPVPHPAGYDRALGLLVLTPLSGDPLPASLLDAGRALPPPGEVVALLEKFAGVALDEPARSPLAHVRGHGRLLRTVLLADRDRVEDLVGRIRAGGDGEPTAVVHGDFYDAQVLVRDGRVAGVVDVDGVGRGCPADDAGNLLAHLLVLRGLASPEAAVHGWLARLTPELLDRHEPHELRRRTAAVLVGLATWPYTQHDHGWADRTRALLDLTDAVLSGEVLA